MKLKKTQWSYKKIFFNILFIISIGCLSLITSTTIDTDSIIKNYTYTTLSVSLSIVFSIFLVLKKFPKKNLKSKKLIVSIILLFIYLFDFFIEFKINNSNPFLMRVINVIGYTSVAHLIIVVSGFSLFIIINFIIDIIYEIAQKFIKSLDVSDKKYLKIFFIVSFFIIFALYGLSEGFCFGWDKVYSIDSHYVARMYTSLFWVGDVRHLFFTTVISPISAFYTFINSVLPTAQELIVPILAYFNAIILAISAVMLKKITNNKYILYLYTVSFPFMLYSLMIEKYQIAVFFVILFLYSLKVKNNKVENLSLIATIGCMTTNVFLGIFSNWQKKFSTTFFKWLKSVVIFMFILIIAGKLPILLTAKEQVTNMMDGNPRPTAFVNRIYGSSEFIYTSLYAPAYKVVSYGDSSYYDRILWENEANHINYTGVIIFGLIAISFILNRKEKAAQVSFFWICCGLSLFLIFDWYSFEAPLFNILYSWAILILLVMLIDRIKNLKLKKGIYNYLMISCLVVNFFQIIQIISFLLALKVDRGIL